MRQITILFVGLLTISTVLIGCKNQNSSQHSDVAAQAEQPLTGPVEVSKEGTKFNPPIRPESLPEDVYYCDMGTVHYARSERGDNRCELCNMFLTHKPAQ